jgi:hypothetical protein
LYSFSIVLNHCKLILKSLALQSHRPTYDELVSRFSNLYLQLGSFKFTSLPLENTHIKTFTSLGFKGVYFGEMEDGSTTSRQGRGITIYDVKEVQVGHWGKDKLNGQARVILRSGDAYQGDYEDNKRNGKGVLYYANGNKWDGEWKNDKKHGEGVLHEKDGKKYKKKFDEGKELESVLLS